MLRVKHEYLDDLIPDFHSTSDFFIVCSNLKVKPQNLLHIIHLTGEYVATKWVNGLGTVKTTYTL